jgi:hypothetical protein
VLHILAFRGEMNNEAISFTYTNEEPKSYVEDSLAFAEDWKYYYAFSPNTPKDDKLKDASRYCRDISLWCSQCFPRVLRDHSNCAKVKMFKNSVALSAQFSIVIDREYSVSIGGQDFIFFHYFMSPSGKVCPNEAQDPQDAGDKLINCSFESVDEDQIIFADFDNCDGAVGPMYAAQRAVKAFASSLEETSFRDHCDAVILCAWIGSLEASIDELVNISPWASKFILECLKNYENNLPNHDSNFILSFGDAMSSLQYQLEHLRSKESPHEKL